MRTKCVCFESDCNDSSLHYIAWMSMLNVCGAAQYNMICAMLHYKSFLLYCFAWSLARTTKRTDLMNISTGCQRISELILLFIYRIEKIMMTRQILFSKLLMQINKLLKRRNKSSCMKCDALQCATIKHMNTKVFCYSALFVLIYEEDKNCLFHSNVMSFPHFLIL